jgi:ligand-binding sensor domain-containing protein
MKNVCILILSLIAIASSSGQNIVFSLKDKAGNLWFTVSERGIYRFDGRDFSKFTGQVGSGSAIVSCIYEDKTGDLWFKTSDGGVCRYDGKIFTGFRIPLPDSNIVGRERYSLLARIPIEVGAMLQDRSGDFWFLTSNHGVYHYSAGIAGRLGHEKSFSQFFVGVAPICIAEDRNNRIVVGCWDGSGVHYYDGNKFTSLHGFSDGMIGCITVDREGGIWLGTRIAGADRWDGKFDPDGRVNVTNFSRFSNRDVNTTNTSLFIFQDSKHKMWFSANWNNLGQRGDAFVYDGAAFTNITENEKSIKFRDFAARSFVEDNNGNIWIGSKNGILLRYDGKSLTDFSQQLSP